MLRNANAMPLKMKVLQYSLLSPVDASMDSRGVDFSDIDAGRSDVGVVEGIAGGRGLIQCGDFALTQNLDREQNIHMFFIYIFKDGQEKAELKFQIILFQSTFW